ncbi:MAG: hypothetical protein J1F42_00015 [Lachnospiraceae bacterium]|nr:hypothetical protein [Lachnospiraceae bacterium]
MTMTISFRLKHEDREVTVMVDSMQNVSGTLHVLAEAGIFPCREYTIRSVRSGRRIMSGLTYEESNIYNGDIILLEWEV